VIKISVSYSFEESEYIEDNWGKVSINGIAKSLNRSIGGILNKKGRLGLGPFLESGEYITINQFFLAIGRTGGNDYALKCWVKKGFPLKTKKVVNYGFKIVYLDDFWKWAEEYRMCIDFNKFKKNALGAEPEWVNDQRNADIAFSKYKVTPWATKEDNHLKSLLKLYKYTYSQLSKSLYRTEGAIKRRMVDLYIKERPLKENCHSIWTNGQVETTISMYNKGYKSNVISEYIDKSAQAISGKVERLILAGVLIKWK